MATEHRNPGGAPSMAWPDPLKDASSEEAAEARELLGLTIEIVRLHKGSQWYRDPEWRVEVALGLESHYSSKDLSDRISANLHEILDKRPVSGGKEIAQSLRVAQHARQLVDNILGHQRIADSMAPARLYETSSLDEQLAREEPNPTAMSSEQAAAERRRHAALMEQWRADPDWAEGERQLDNTDVYMASEQFKSLAKVESRGTINRWRIEGKIIGLPSTGRGYRYPVAQLDVERQIPMGLAKVIEVMGNGYTTWYWLTSPNPDLDGGGTPLEALKGERVADVLEMARAKASGAFV